LSNNPPSENVSARMDHTRLYKQMREQKRKKKHDDNSKYDQIINRLEAQLQGPKNSEESIEDVRHPSKGERNNRYKHIDEEAVRTTPQNEEEEVIEERIKLSNIKENSYKTQLEALNEEKRRLDCEREALMREKN
jgi:hypothetical protein